MLEGTFANHGYALGLRINSPYRKAIDLALLQIVESDDWQTVLATYL